MAVVADWINGNRYESSNVTATFRRLAIQKKMNLSSKYRGLLVNVGCGDRFHSDWLNLDLIRKPGVTKADITQGLPVRDNEAMAVYSAAVLEHIRPQEVPDFLAECHRVLQPGGLIRIAVPDFERQVQAYLDAMQRADAGQDANPDREWMLFEIVDQFAREVSGGEMARFLASADLPNKEFIASRIGNEGSSLIRALKGNTAQTSRASLPHPAPVRGGRLGRLIMRFLLRSKNLQRDLQALSVGRFRLSGETHQWAYDRYSLTAILEQAGFTNIQVCDHGKSSIDRWDDFHLEVDEDGNVEKPDLLIAEATKAA